MSAPSSSTVQRNIGQDLVAVVDLGNLEPAGDRRHSRHARLGDGVAHIAQPHLGERPQRLGVVEAHPADDPVHRFGEARQHEAVVAPGGVPGDATGFQHRHRPAAPRDLARGREPGEAGADDADVDVEIEGQRPARGGRHHGGGVPARRVGRPHLGVHVIFPRLVAAAPHPDHAYSLVPRYGHWLGTIAIFVSRARAARSCAARDPGSRGRGSGPWVPALRARNARSAGTRGMAHMPLRPRRETPILGLPGIGTCWSRPLRAIEAAAMRLMLLRHAKAEKAEPGMPDHARLLNARGRSRRGIDRRLSRPPRARPRPRHRLHRAAHLRDLGAARGRACGAGDRRLRGAALQCRGARRSSPC